MPSDETQLNFLHQKRILILLCATLPSMSSPLTIETTVDAPIETVWRCWTEPEHIMQRAGWQSILDNFKSYTEAQ